MQYNLDRKIIKFNFVLINNQRQKKCSLQLLYVKYIIHISNIFQYDSLLILNIPKAFIEKKKMSQFNIKNTLNCLVGTIPSEICLRGNIFYPE